MAIDTEMPGKPDQVHAVADWLERLKTTAGDAAGETGRIARVRDEVWEGNSADAYGEFNRDLKKATEEVEDRASAVAEKTRAYAQQLTWRQQDMADHRDRAREGGLTVDGFVIQAPPAAAAVPDLPADHTPAERADHEDRMERYTAAREKIELYDDLLVEVRETFDRLDTWVRDNLVTMESEASSPFSIAALAGVLGGLAWGIPENRFTTKGRELRAAGRAAAWDLAQRRSGNPAVRSGSVPPREAALARAGRPGTRAGNLFGLADDADVWGRRLARGGVVTAIALGAWEISQGKSPSTAIVETGAGIAAGAALTVAAGAAIAAGAPVIAVVGGAVILGAGASYVAGWAYENFVPQDVREAIDEGIEDAWNGAVDVAEDVGGAISDGWNAVFG